MLAKRIIPCLDVKDSRVVKGTHFVELKDAGDPIALAQLYDNHGADELVFLDITATNDKRDVLLDLIAACAKKLFIPFTVGGGIGDCDTIRHCLLAGADKVSINSAAISNPALISDAAHAFGSQCLVVAIDAKATGPNTWEIYTHGGRKKTGIDAITWAQHMAARGAGELLVTSMDKDGTKSGYDIALTQAIASAVRIPVIASGGAGTHDHISDILGYADAALLASILHFKETSIAAIKAHCNAQQLPIRL